MSTSQNEECFLSSRIRPNVSTMAKGNLKDGHNNGKSKKQYRKRLKETFNTELLYRRLPIVTWLPTYNWSFAVFDLIAGITVGLTIIPQSIAYASVAGLPLEVCGVFDE